MCIVMSVGFGAVSLAEPEQNVEVYKKQVQENNKSLEHLKTKIREKSIHSEKLKGKENNINGELKRINNELSKIQKKINQLNKKITVTQTEIRKNQVHLIGKKLEAENTRKRLKRHLLLLYKYKKNTMEYLPAVLTDVPYAEVVQGDKYLCAIGTMNVKLYKQLKNQEEEIAMVKKELEAKERMLEQLQEEVRGQEEVALKQRTAKQELLAQVKEQRKTTEEEIGTLRKEARELQGLIDSFRSKISTLEKERRKQRASVHAHKKGSFEWPVNGAVIQQFGKHKNSDLNAYVINNGIEIQAATGSLVNVIEKGVVLYANVFKSYGNMVIVDHGDDFYTVYAHLQKLLVKEGDALIKSQSVGITGNGSNGRSGKANLYFEIRQNGKPENPLLWLK